MARLDRQTRHSVTDKAPAASPWHVSARADTVAYAFSWLPPLAALVVFGERFLVRVALFIGITVVSEVHRCWTFGYAFLGSEVRRRSRARFVILPIVALASMLACTLLLTLDRRRALFGPSLSVDATVESLAIVAGAWNMYHALAQKYGLLRVYAGKLGGRAASRGADRALMLSPLLLVPAWVLPEEAPSLARAFPMRWAQAALALLEKIRTPLFALALLTAALALGWFLASEWRANRFRSRPRLTLVAGTVLLCACFVFLHPLYAYMAFVFAHAVEYMVFVAAFLRRRAEHTDDRLSRMVRRPVRTYGVFVLALSALFLAGSPWIPMVWPWLRWSVLGGDGPDDWVRPWSIFSALLHFYYDGNLWKLGRDEVTKHL